MLKSFKKWLQFIVLTDLCVILRGKQVRTTKTCSDLEIIGDSNITVIEDRYVNIGFTLTTWSCDYIPDWFRVKASTVEGRFLLLFCSILFQNGTCVVTGTSPICRCDGQNSAAIHKKVSRSDTAYILEWADSKTYPTQNVKKIFLNVTAKKGLDSLIIILTAAGSGFCICIFIIVIVCVMRRRLKKRDEQSSNGARQNQEEREDLYENKEELADSFGNAQFPIACRFSASYKVHNADYVEPVLHMADVLISLRRQFQQRP